MKTRDTLSITSEPVPHQPFTISNGRSNFIGFLDMQPDSLGYHVKGDMNGLWFPPLRIFKNLVIKIEGSIVKPCRVQSFADRRIFSFEGFRLNIMATDEGILALEFEPVANQALSVTAEFELSVIGVWLSEVDPGLAVDISSGRADLNVDNYNISFHIISDPLTAISFASPWLKLDVTDKTTIHIHESQPVPAQGRLPSNSMVKHDLFTDVFETSTLDSDSVELERMYYWAKVNLKWLMLSSAGLGAGITAGHPDFPWYFSADSFYSINGMLLAGFSREVGTTLSTLAEAARRDGNRIPHEIITNKRIYHQGNIEEIALFPVALASYLDWTGNKDLIARNIDVVEASMDFLRINGLSGPGIMEDHAAGEGIDIDTVCAYAQALKSYRSLSMRVDDNCVDSSLNDEYNKLASRIDSDFWMPEVKGFANRLIDGEPKFKKFWTTIIPFSTALSDRRHYADFVSSGSIAFQSINSQLGLKVDDKGNIMPLGTGLMVKAAANYGDEDTALSFFRKNMASFGKYSPGCFPEIVNNATGCYLQAWSAGIFIENIFSDLMRIDFSDGRLRAHPGNAIRSLGKYFKIEHLIRRGEEFSFELS